MLSSRKQEIIQLLSITFGGLFTFAIFWLLYVSVYATVEYAFYPNNPTEVPAGLLRFSCSIILLVAYYFIQKIKISNLVKSILLVAPVSMISISILMTLYQHAVVQIFTGVLFIVISLLIYRKIKKPWYYLYALLYAVVLAIMYTWPF